MKRNLVLSTLLAITLSVTTHEAYSQAAARPLPVYIPGTAQRQAFSGNTLPANITKPTASARVMKPVASNYTSFSQPVKNNTTEAQKANAKYLQHPEVNQLSADAPCDNCYELIGERTETTKTFAKNGVASDGSKVMMTQTANMPMHYRDNAGNWRTIKSKLEPNATLRGIYTATEQPVPVAINTIGSAASTTLGKTGESIQFNNRLELVYVQPNGNETSLGFAKWTNHTAGDQGIYVTNAWPGIDIEIRTYRGAVKTNFHVNRAMPAYAAGSLRIRDHVQLDKDLVLAAISGATRTNGALEIKNASSELKYVMTGVVVSEQNDGGKVNQLDYVLGNNNTLDIELPGGYLNKPSASYPVIIDPLVSQATSIPVAGASYNATWAALQGCLYSNPANTPINCTVTDIQFSFEYVSTVAMRYCAFSFYKGACRNPGTAAGGLSWSCNTLTAGTCTSAGGAAYSIFSDLAPCLPPPSCASVALNIDMYFYQNWATTAPCVTTYVAGSQPLVITVIGRTVEVGNGGSVSASPNVICNGQSSTLSGTGAYGVPPYSWSWTPGPVAGSPAVVSPTVTTNYTGTVTDACGITASANVSVTVNPREPIAGPTSVCMGATITLSNPVAGTWASLAPAVATISGAGVVSGVSPGQSAIVYTTNAGCQSTTTILVTPLPGPITGNTTMCEGSATTLGNTAPGGTWISSNIAVATISSAGVVQSVTAGTSNITYTFGGTCLVTTSVLVNPFAPITGNATICQEATSQLSDIVPAGTWSSSSAGVASVDGTGMMYGVAGGTATISYSNPFGCIATLPVTINALPVISNILPGDPTTCNGVDGSITLGSFASGSYAIDYTFDGGTIPTATVTTTGSNILLSGLVQGVYNGFIVTDANTGCVSASAGPVTLKDPIPPPMPEVRDNLPICAGQTLKLLATDDVPGGTWSWTGPNGFTSIEQDVIINNVPLTASGPYTVTYILKNCPVSTTRNVIVTPPLTLTGLTLDQTIPYGATIQLDVKGALYYEWLAVDGTVDNPNINNPVVKPEKTTTYTVVGVNAAGCRDTGHVTIIVDQNMADGIPSAFTPNGDGLNDIFRVVNLKYQKLVEFTIYNRWGQLVYQNRYDLNHGWDGTFNGQPQDLGVYTYKITIITAEGLTKYYKGDVMLVR